jgi:hypothetical protein
MLALHVQDVVPDLERRLVRIVMGAPASICQPLHPLLVTIKDLVARLAEIPNSLHRSAMRSPVSRRATNCSLSSMTEHSFHGIHFLLKESRKCNICVRYVLLPMCRVAQTPYVEVRPFDLSFHWFESTAEGSPRKDGARGCPRRSLLTKLYVFDRRWKIALDSVVGSAT